jgi:hypothetical protein
LNLANGVGQAGDRFERNADEVADLVVRGQSAVSKLDAILGVGRRPPSPAQSAPDEPPEQQAVQPKRAAKTKSEHPNAPDRPLGLRPIQRLDDEEHGEHDEEEEPSLAEKMSDMADHASDKATEWVGGKVKKVGAAMSSANNFIKSKANSFADKVKGKTSDAKSRFVNKNPKMAARLSAFGAKAKSFKKRAKKEGRGLNKMLASRMMGVRVGPDNKITHRHSGLRRAQAAGLVSQAPMERTDPTGEDHVAGGWRKTAGRPGTQSGSPKSQATEVPTAGASHVDAGEEQSTSDASPSASSEAATAAPTKTSHGERLRAAREKNAQRAENRGRSKMKRTMSKAARGTARSARKQGLGKNKAAPSGKTAAQALPSVEDYTASVTQTLQTAQEVSSKPDASPEDLSTAAKDVQQLYKQGLLLARRVQGPEQTKVKEHKSDLWKLHMEITKKLMKR